MNDQNDENDESIVVPIVVFSIAAFIGNFGVSVTGFGMAIIFLFVYTIADLANLVECAKCTLRDAVFFQTLALGSAIPLMLFNSRKIIKEHWSKELLVTFLPATVVGTPVGNFLQDHLPSDILRTVVGVVITALILYQLSKMIPNSTLYKRCKEKGTEQEENNIDEDDEKAAKAEENSPSYPNLHSTDGEEVQHPSDEGDEIINGVDHANSNDGVEKQVKEEVDEAENGSVSPNLSLVQKEEDIQTDDEKKTEELEETIPTGLKLRVWGFVLGFLSGFLGGLMGVRGPPLMVFFLMFAFPKNVVRANAVIILFVNVGIRIIYYIIEDVSGQRGDDPWFDSSYTVLYICVVVFGILGVPIGDYVATKLNQQQFKLFVAVLLLFSGLSNLIKGSINLATS